MVRSKYRKEHGVNILVNLLFIYIYIYYLYLDISETGRWRWDTEEPGAILEIAVCWEFIVRGKVLS